MTGLTCLHCGAESKNGTVLCKRCMTTISAALANVASYHADLLSIGGVQVRIRRSSSSVSDPTGAAVSQRSAPGDQTYAPDVAAADTRTMLVGWVRVLLDDRPQLQYPADTVSAMTRFLTDHTSSIATLEWAGELARDSLLFEQRLKRIIQRSKGSWYAGICSAELEPERQHDEHSCLCVCHRENSVSCDVDGGTCHPELKVIPANYCTRDLYALPGSVYVRCPSCMAQWRVAERRYILFEEARETLLPVPVIARALVALLDEEPSVRRLTDRLNKWVQRGDLEDYGVRVITGRPMRVYRMGDVLDTLTGSKPRTTA